MSGTVCRLLNHADLGYIWALTEYAKQSERCMQKMLLVKQSLLTVAIGLGFYADS